MAADRRGGGETLRLPRLHGNLVGLPLKLPFRSGEALVVRRDFAGHPELLVLRQLLLARLKQWSRSHPELTVVP